MSLLLAGLVFAGTSGALFVGRWIARRRSAERADAPAPDDDPKAGDGTTKDGEAEDAAEAAGRDEVEREVPAGKDEDEPPKEDDDRKRPPRTRPAKTAGERPRLEGFVCQLGDVIMRITGEEAWLAGGLVLSEQIPVAVLFVAPEAGHDCAIYARARPRESILWLEPLDPSAILVAGEPPSSVEHDGIRFDRARRLPVRTRRIGVGAPDVGDAVTVAEYASAGAERLLVLKGNAGVVRAYRGVELERGAFEVIASGETTLDP